jgi:probable phosphoglycerate mutase
MTTPPQRPTLVLIRHGETEWSRTRQHTGRSDIPLLEEGQRMARQLAKPLERWRFSSVWVSPLRRAAETCALSGHGHEAYTVADLAEWDYGAYEGRTPDDIRLEHPSWNLWRDGVPGGETVGQVGARADRVIARALGQSGTIALFAHGHLLRILAARWMGLPPDGGRLFTLDTGSLSELGWDARGEQRVLVRWNDTAHL